MSHFTVLVTRTNKDYNDIEKQLEPFCEERRMPMHIAKTKSQLIREGRDTMISAKRKYESWKADPVAYGGSNPNHLKWLKDKVPAMIVALEKNDEAAFYKEGISWYEEDDLDKDGNYITESNDDSKWDWYQTGGRWSGYFIPKKGASGELGTPSLLMEKKDKLEILAGKGVDVIKVKDIDWQAMDQVAKDHRAKHYDEQMEKPKKEQFIWEDNRDKVLKMTRDEYINQPISHSTFAVLHRGVWYEKGNMGWWAMVANEKEQEKWDEEWKKLIESLDPEDEISLVDCHI